MSEPHVLTSVDDGVMLVTLNRPDILNAIGQEMISGLLEALSEANAREDVYAVVLTGAGDGFCAGGEITEEGRLALFVPVPTREQRLERQGWPALVAMAFVDSDVPIIGGTAGRG